MFKTVIWATDGSDNADRALPYAKELAAEHGGSLVIAHIVQRFASGARGVTWQADEEEVVNRIKALAEDLSRAGFNCSLRVVNDIGLQPAHELAAIAADVDADLIVMGTRGYPAIGGLLLGSVTQRLLHIAPCPVLTVPPEKYVIQRDGDAQAITVAS